MNAEAKTNKVAESDTVSTPYTTDSKKRPLSSPLDPCETKKQITMSEPTTNPEIISQDSQDGLSNTDIPIMSSSHACTPNISLGEKEMTALASALKSSFQFEIREMITNMMASTVQSIVDGVLEGLNERIASLESKNESLVKENDSLRTENMLLREKVEELEFTTDNLEQYSRRNNLRLSGIPETPTNSNTDKVILDLCKDLGISLSESDIDRSHRVGRPNGPKPRQIIVKFTSYRARQKLFKERTQLKKSHRNVYVNEDLTKKRNKLFYDARQLLRRSLVDGAWSSDGVIMVKDKLNKIHRVQRTSDLSRFQ